MRQAEMYFFNMMQQLGLLKKAIFCARNSPFLTGPLLHHVKKVHFGLAHLHLLN